MAGIMGKIGDALHIGGDKKDENKKHEGEYSSDHKKQEGDYKSDHKPEKKEGIVDKIKDKITGDGGSKQQQQRQRLDHYDRSSSSISNRGGWSHVESAFSSLLFR
ncbi:unnamed protein product [Lactuca virosa]|uniref:Dehydrin n=1 Tax=Lactuca virosa TaxID=75947 RepID=A0AAU9N8Q3_9ASTR|nr:unnamed protein product [Lactuca virosa]